MKKIFNLTTIISTGALNFIKAADKDKGISEKNVIVFIDGVKYEAKGSDNGYIKKNKDLDSFLIKIVNDDYFINSLKSDKIGACYSFYFKYSDDGLNYFLFNNHDLFNKKFLKLYFFKNIEVTVENNFKINNGAFIGEIKSLEDLKYDLNCIDQEKEIYKGQNFKKKIEKIYEFFCENFKINSDLIIKSYKIDGNETIIYENLTLEDLEKIYEAISQKKSVDIVLRKNDTNYCFANQYFINIKEFEKEKLIKLINFKNLLDSWLNISFNLLSEEEVKNYLKNQYGIDGEIIISSGRDVKYITLPDKYLLFDVVLSFDNYKSNKGKTLKYDYLNQLELNKDKIYKKGTKYSDLKNNLESEYEFLKGKKYKLQISSDNSESEDYKDININDEVKPGNVYVEIEVDKVNDDLFIAVDKDIKKVNIQICGSYYSLYLKQLKNKDILSFIECIIKNRGLFMENNIIKYLNESKEEIPIENNDNELDKRFYFDPSSDDKSIEINVNIISKETEDDEDDEDDGDDGEKVDNKDGDDEDNKDKEDEENKDGNGKKKKDGKVENGIPKVENGNKDVEKGGKYTCYPSKTRN